MVESIVMILLVAALVIALLMWLGPQAGIPGNILNLLKIIVIVYAIFKLLAALGFLI